MDAEACGHIEVDGVKYWKPNMAAIDDDFMRAMLQAEYCTPIGT